MNYKRIYDRIVERSKNRNLFSIFEKHHVLPKCLGGINSESNIVKLTPREHFLCHYLLTKIFNEDKIIFAFWCMINGNGIPSKERHVPSSRVYKKMKEEASKRHSILNKKLGIIPPSRIGVPHRDEIKKQISRSLTGRKQKPRSKEHSRKIVESRNGKIFGMSGKLHSIETKRKISDSLRRNNGRPKNLLQ